VHQNPFGEEGRNLRDSKPHLVGINDGILRESKPHFVGKKDRILRESKPNFVGKKVRILRESKPIFFLLKNEFCGNQTSDLVKEEGLILRENRNLLWVKNQSCMNELI
jgi:RNase P/RNase MRP subunit p29